MKVYFYALMAMSIIYTQIVAAESDSSANEVDEVVVTSSILNSSRIINPLYVIDGDEIQDNATTSLGEAVDSYLGCLLYTSPSPRDQSGSRMPSSA